ncbi:spore coat protein SP96 [Drosophila obscura]|uniref:spore coat protein SP96 n=1 Tax=Drosophila obscura TaxID=7282 RepID=UPI001BB1CC1B|nr:spore coat protein SP96 [Drosophila obscura]
MYAQVCVLLLAVGLSQAFASEPVLLPQEHLMRLVMQSRDAGSDASHTLECLAYYMAEINAAAEKLDTDTKQCISEAQIKVEAIVDTTQPNRTAIENSGASSCEALNECSSLADPKDYFTCTAQAGSANAKSMFTISADSNELVAQIEETRRLITVWQNDCTNKTQREYAENSAALYEGMGDCMAGGDVPTTGPTPGPDPSTTSSPGTDPSTTSSPGPDPSTTSSPGPDPSTTSSPGTDPSTTDTTESSTTESSTEASTESTTVSSTESTTVSSTESTTVSSTESTTVSSTDSSSASTTEQSTTAEQSTTTEQSTTADDSDNKESPPEEDLDHLITKIETQGNADLKQIVKNIQQWLKRY